MNTMKEKQISEIVSGLVNKTNFAAYIVIGCMVLFLGDGSAIFHNYHPINNPIGFIIYFLCGAYLCVKCDFYAGKSLIFTFLLILGWILYHYFVDREFEYISYGLLGLNLIMAYLLIRRYKFEILYYFERIVYWLACVSLIFWIINNLVGFEGLNSLAPFDSSPMHIASESRGSFLFYTVGKLSEYDTEASVYGIIRNAGFAWESGRFSSILVFSLALYLVRLKNQISYKRVLVYIISIITTLSTTGYVALLCLLLMHLLFVRNINRLIKSFLWVSLFCTIPYVYDLNFMGEKINKKINTENFLTNRDMSWIAKSDGLFTVDRFEGIVLDGLNFVDSPWLGYGLSNKDSYVYREISPYIVTSNGVVKPMAQWGALLGIIFLLLYARATRYYCKLMQYRFSFVLLITTLIVSISYNFFNSVIFWSIALCPLFLLDKELKSYITKVGKQTDELGKEVV